MDQAITETNYPIKNAWLIKQSLPIILYFFFIVPFISLFPAIYLSKLFNIHGLMFFVILVLIPIFILAVIFFLVIYIVNLQRKNFHFQLTDKFINVEQGVLSKQKRFLPYSVIQNVSIDQDFIDRILKIANLVVENASSGGGIGNLFMVKRGGNVRPLGFSGSKINILGLDPKDAEALKLLVLQKVKENPANNNSGL